MKPLARLRNAPRAWLYGAFAMTAMLALLALLAWLATAGHLLPFEQRTLAVMAGIRNPMADNAMLALTWAGSSLILGPIVLAVTAILLYRRRIAQAVLLGMTFSGAALTTWLLKTLFERARPELFPSPLDILPPDAAFPSGHTTHAAAAALGVWLLCRRHPRAGVIAGVLILVVAGVALSRLYLQVHWPADILAGLLIAGIWGLLAVRVAETHGIEKESSR